MAGKRRSFSRELKLEAVALVTEGGLSVTQAARDLGISESMWAPSWTWGTPLIPSQAAWLGLAASFRLAALVISLAALAFGWLVLADRAARPANPRSG